MDAQNTMHPNAVTLYQLPSELLAMLILKLGIKVAMKCLPQNSKLHRAWQESVHKVDIKTKFLSYQSIKTLLKYVNLRKLRLHGASTGSIPVWRAIAFVAPSLTRLRSVSILDVNDTYAVLKTLAGMESVANRLESLHLEDNKHSLGTDDLWALVDLKALTGLFLRCRTVEGDQAQLDTICKLLSSLRKLDLGTAPGSDEPTSPSTLAAFPGSITSLTSLVLSIEGPGNGSEEEQALISAVSALTNLQGLTTNYCLSSAAAQQQALRQLKQLTCLQLGIDQGLPALGLPADLESLVRLVAPCHSVADPFEQPALEKLEAGRLVVGQQWRGKTAEECSISKLSLTDWEDEADFAQDEELQNMPLLPELTSFSCALHRSDVRYAHLAALLHRQASSLTYCKLALSQALEEVLPRELPACTQLSLTSNAVSQHTLQLLAMCSMPNLVELDLRGSFANSAVVGLDLAWLRGLPALKKLTLASDVDAAAWEEISAAVVALMEGSGVELVLLQH